MTGALFLFDSDIDFSFAICPQPPQDYLAHQQPPCIKTNSAYPEPIPHSILFSGRWRESNNRHLLSCVALNDGSPLDSCRTVTFADKIVSEVKSVPRYETESKRELFYNRLDLLRFRQEARLERMHKLQVV